MLPFRAALAALPLFAVGIGAQGPSGLQQQYCSSENTGADSQDGYSIYQSMGKCYQQCVGNYAFAVVQYQNCWCSDYIPSDQQDTSSCNQKCPGYPDDLCGNKNNGLYGYIALKKSPSGTAGGSSSEASSTPPPSTSSSELVSTSTPTGYSSSSGTPSSTIDFASSTTSVVSSSDITTTSSETSESSSFQSTSESVLTSSEQTSTSESSTEQPPSTTSSYVPQTTSTPTSTSTPTPSSTPPPPSSTSTSTSSSSVEPSETPSPVVSTRVVTLSGAIVTQTVTSTPLVATNPESQNQQFQRKSLSGGAIAGIVIGVLLGLAALALAAFLLWRRSRNNNGSFTGGSSSRGGPRGSPRRNVSVLSKAGLLGRGAGDHDQDMAERDYDDGPLYVNTGSGAGGGSKSGRNSVRNSLMFGAGAHEGVSPVSPLGGSSQDGSGSSRRHSRPMVYDQRLNPSALFGNLDNGSRVSMQDNADYSRPLEGGRTLGVANPDPRASFESRM